jgi:hypothetical protein
MLGLTSLGVLHTAVGVVAVAAGLVAILRDGAISARNLVGRIYVVMTVVTCVTAFGIFEHGGFGKAHGLGVVTLVVLAVAVGAEYADLFGRASPYVETVGYSATLLFHAIPAITEASTRLPPAAPLVASQEAPALRVATVVLLVVFLIGARLQVRRRRAAPGGR